MGQSATPSPLASQRDDAPNWVKMTDRAGWRPRDSQGQLVHRKQMWILGGQEDFFFGDEKSLKSDVW